MRGHIYKNSEGFIGMQGFMYGAGDVAGAASAASSLDVSGLIQAGGEAAGAIISAIAGVRDANLRRKFEENMALLEKDQQTELGKQLLQAQTQSERTNILAQVLSQSSQQRVSGFYGKGSEVALWIVGGAILLGVGFLLYKKVKSKR